MADHSKPEPCEFGVGSTGPDPALPLPPVTEGEMDISLLQDSLAKTPWERMQANDDAVRFMDALRTAMEKRHARS